MLLKEKCQCDELDGGRIKFGNYFYLHRHPIQLVLFIPVGLKLLLRHRRLVLLGVEVSSVARPGQLIAGIQIAD